jgi:hypothetical protein
MLCINKNTRLPMRFLCAVAFAGVFGASVPALADSITYEVPFSFYTFLGSDTVYGPQFNPYLGTLTGASAFVSGTYLPDITGASVPSQTTAALWVQAAAPGGGLVPTEVGTYTLTDGKGPAQAFSFSTGPITGLQYYIDPNDYPAWQTGWLINVDAYSAPLTPYAWGDWDDQSTYSGTVYMTYTYTVPEPSSLAILAFGAGLLGLGRVQRRRPSVVAPA